MFACIVEHSLARKAKLQVVRNRRIYSNDTTMDDNKVKVKVRVRG